MRSIANLTSGIASPCGIRWRRHSCLPRRHSCRRRGVLHAKRCREESRHRGQQCLRHPLVAKSGLGVLMLESSISAMITGGVQLITGVRARWLGCGPADAPRIYFANHTSHLDFVLLWSALPAQLRRRTRPVAAGDYWKEGALRRYFSGQVFRSVLVDRVCSCRSAAPTVAMLEVLDR